MKKWFLRLAVVGLILLCAVSLSTKLLLSKEFLVQEIEDSINSRVQVGEMDVSLFSVPAKVTLKNVLLAKRDSVADDKVDYSDRDELAAGVITLKSVSFQVSLWELISKKIAVESFELDGLHANVVLHEDGSNSLDELFAEPEKEEKKKDRSKKKKKKSFNAKEKEEFVTELKSVQISNVSCDLLIEKTGLLVKGADGTLSLNDIKVDPNQLEVVNQANLKLALQLKVYDGVGMANEYAELGIDGAALTQLFDSKTGEIDPNVEFDFQISESAYVSSEVPYVQKIWKKGEKLEKVGIKLGSLPEKAVFGRDRKLAGSYKRGRVDFADDLSIMVDEWEIAANKGSWVDSGSEQHEFFIDVCASKKSTASLVKHSSKLLKKLPRELRGDMEKTLFEDLMKNGKVTLSFHTSKSLSFPKIRSLTELPEVKKLINEAAKKGALDFLLRKLR